MTHGFALHGQPGLVSTERLDWAELAERLLYEWPVSYIQQEAEPGIYTHRFGTTLLATICVEEER